MGQFLSSEAAEKLGDALQQGVDFDPTETETSTSEPAEDENQEAEDQEEASPETADADADAETNTDESSADSPEGEDEGEGKGSMHRVPYDRFKSVIDARNQYKHETETLRKQMLEMQEQLKQSPPQPATRQVEQSQQDQSWDYDTDDEPLDPLEKKYFTLEGRMNQMAVYQAEQQLEREIGHVQNSYPSVPRELLLQAVVLDGASDLMSIAENFSSHIASVEEGAIARHIASAKPKRETPPRAPKSGSPRAQIRASRDGQKDKPRNVAEASKALAEFLRRENPFSS